MPRNLSADMITALSQPNIQFVIFVELESGNASPQEYVRVWNGLREITWDGKTWTGVGKFGNISPLNETTEIRAEGIKLSLSGIPSDLITYAMDNALPGKLAKVWLAVIAEVNSPPVETILADPFLSFSGKTDSVTMNDAGDSATIEISVENKLIGLHRARQRRYTHEDQQQEFPDDMGFEYVERIQDLNLTVGRSGAPPFGYGYPVAPPEPPQGE